MSAPVNVVLENPTDVVENWEEQAEQWLSLNAIVRGNRDFYPLTIKAAYIIGVIHDLCQSVSHLLKFESVQTTYIPAYGVFAAGVEVLGRCIRGNDSLRGAVADLKMGFRWLAYSSHKNIPYTSVDRIPDGYVLIETSNGEYTINRLTYLRHFSAHGQATAQELGGIDYEILGNMPSLIANGLERYWSDELQNNTQRCNDLARANIRAFRDWPVFKSWSLFERDEHGKYHSITEIFNRFDWHI